MDIKKNTPDQVKATPVQSPGSHRWFIGLYFLLALGFLAFYLLLRWGTVYFSPSTNKLLDRLSLAGMVCSILLAIARFTEKQMSRNAHSRTLRYNIIRFIRLITILLIVFVIISFLNANWYTAAMSLGLISLILGFALQTPIASLIGWFYIIARTPFRVGDRIQVGSFTGDVVEINYLDTTLWEFAGNYMTNDLPSGRLIRFPNSLVFTSEVYNYSWKKFPYIWNEIPFHVAYESDLEYLEQTIRRVTKEELGDKMESKVNILRQLISETPVDELEIKEYPFVQFRTNVNTWIEVLVIYLVEPKHSGSVRSRIIKRILSELMKEPEKALFPKSNAR